MSSSLDNCSKKNNFMATLSGVLISICITLISILAFALLIRFTNLNDSWIFPVNQVIKIGSLFVGIFVMLKKCKCKGFVRGLLLGLLYFVISYLIFSILRFNFSLSMSNIYDFLITILMGGLIGLIVINIVNK